VGPCHHGMAHSWVASGGESLLEARYECINMQCPTTEMGQSSCLRIEQGANNNSL